MQRGRRAEKHIVSVRVRDHSVGRVSISAGPAGAEPSLPSAGVSTMPALANMSVGSLEGTSGPDGSNMCSRPSK